MGCTSKLSKWECDVWVNYVRENVKYELTREIEKTNNK